MPTDVFEGDIGLVEVLRQFVNDVSHFTRRQRLVLLKEDSCRGFDIQFSEEIVVLCEY